MVNPYLPIRSRRSMFAALLIVGLLPQHAQAWGDQGHRLVALIAERYLDPTARTKLDAMLSGDTDSLTPHDIAGESIFAEHSYENQDDIRATRTPPLPRRNCVLCNCTLYISQDIARRQRGRRRGSHDRRLASRTVQFFKVHGRGRLQWLGKKVRGQGVAEGAITSNGSGSRDCCPLAVRSRERRGNSR